MTLRNLHVSRRNVLALGAAGAMLPLVGPQPARAAGAIKTAAT